MNTQPCAYKQDCQKTRGFSIAVIMMAVFLLGLLGMALTLMDSGSGITTSADKQSKVLAGVILRQATTINDAFQAIHANGCPVSWIGFAYSGTSSSCLMQDPTTGAMEPQNPPVQAFITSTNATWIWKANTNTGPPNVKLQNVGTSSVADYVVALAGLTQSVCQQLNQQLLGSTTIAAPSTGTASNWSTAATGIDLSADSKVNGIYAQCIKTTDGSYVFYNVVKAE